MSGFENFKRINVLMKIKDELKEYDFEMKLLRDAESYIALAGDGEAVYLFLIMLPYAEEFKIIKRLIWRLKTLAYKFKAKPYILTYNVMTTVYPLHALEDGGEYFILDTEKSKGLMFSFDTIVSEQLQERLTV